MKFKYSFFYVLYSPRASIWSSFYCSMTIVSIFRGGRGTVVRLWKMCRVVLLLVVTYNFLTCYASSIFSHWVWLIQCLERISIDRKDIGIICNLYWQRIKRWQGLFHLWRPVMVGLAPNSKVGQIGPTLEPNLPYTSLLQTYKMRLRMMRAVPVSVQHLHWVYLQKIKRNLEGTCIIGHNIIPDT